MRAAFSDGGIPAVGEGRPFFVLTPLLHMLTRTTDAGTRYCLKDDGVEVNGSPAQQRILDGAAKVYAATQQPLVVTAGSDGDHMEGSLHYEHRALDLRVWELDDHERTAAELQQLLGPNYDVVAEWRVQGDGEVPSHLHSTP